MKISSFLLIEDISNLNVPFVDHLSSKASAEIVYWLVLYMTSIFLSVSLWEISRAKVKKFAEILIENSFFPGAVNYLIVIINHCRMRVATTWIA